MEKKAMNPSKRNPSTETAQAAMTNPDRHRHSANETGTAVPSVREKALNSAPATPAAESGDGSTAFSPAERRKLIANAAYRREEKRGYPGGNAEQDWLEAEAEIDRELGRQRS